MLIQAILNRYLSELISSAEKSTEIAVFPQKNIVDLALIIKRFLALCLSLHINKYNALHPFQ